MRTGYHHPEIEKEYFKALVGKSSLKKVFEIICKKTGINADPDKLCNFYKQFYIKHKKIDKNMVGLIKRLKKHYKVYCLTDTNRVHFESHQEQGILKLFDKSFASHLLGSLKSDVNVFRRIVKKLKLGSQEIIFVDDIEKNIENAKSLGIKAILFEDYRNLNKRLIKQKII